MKKVVLSFMLAVSVFLYNDTASIREVKSENIVNDDVIADNMNVQIESQENNKEEAAIKGNEEKSKINKNDNMKTFIVTAYTAGYESTGKTKYDPTYGITASGEKVEEGITIACPKSMEFGTQVYIPFFNNTFICTDRGGAIKEGRLDVYMENLNDALEFGKRELEVKILN